MTGYNRESIFFGESDNPESYQKWEIQEGYDIYFIEAHGDLNGEYIQYLKFAARNEDGLVDEKEFGTRVTEYDTNGGAYPR